MRTFCLKICFDGSAYHGWQVQSNALALQQVLQNALEKVFKIRPDLTGCSRTDAGVHALAYYCHFQVETRMKGEQIVAALNARLPLDIAVLDCLEANDGFHARYSALSKTYIYKIYNASLRSPFLKNRALHYHCKLDEQLLDSAAQAFVGKHDFGGFCSTGSHVDDTVRTVFEAGVFREGNIVCFRVRADGFLYNMVRIMAGTLLMIAQRKILPSELPEIIKSGQRGRAGDTAPPHGLYLEEVLYREDDLRDA